MSIHLSIELRETSLAYGGEPALTDISLQIAAGERVAIIGPSGAGKTSLLRMLATAQKPDRGTLRVLDCDPWSLSARARQTFRTRVGLIHQAPPIPPRQRVITAVAAGRLGRWPIARSLINLVHPLDAETISRVLKRFDLADKLYARCDQLSGGELQRIGIARVLYQAPELILADEPVSAMDPLLANHTLTLLHAEAQACRMTLVASLHAVDLALRHFPRVIGLRDGRILFDKAASEVQTQDLKALYANLHLDPHLHLDHSLLRPTGVRSGPMLRATWCGGTG